MDAATDDIVRIVDLTAGYGDTPVLRGLDLSLRKGETCCVIGEEGSGKSTLLKAVTRQINSGGTITYGGTDLCAVPTTDMTRHGVDYIAQGGNILKGFTVEEHVQLASSGRGRAEQNEVWREIEKTFPKLIALKRQVAGRLSGGERMMLSIACLMATDADFLILDEPTAGLAPETCDSIKEFLFRVKFEQVKTILLLEHNYEFAFEVADSVVTLREGRLSEKFFGDDFRQAEFIDTRLYSGAAIPLR